MPPATADHVREVLAEMRDKVDRKELSLLAPKLSSCGPEVVPLLLDTLANGVAADRASAVHALGLIANQHPETWVELAPVLMALLEDDDLRVRRNAVIVLSILGPQVRDAIPHIIDVARREEGAFENRPMVGLALVRLGEPGFNALVGLLDESEIQLRFLALATLAKLEARAKPAKPALLRALGDKEPTIRSAAAGTMMSAGILQEDEAAVRALAATLAKEEAAWARQEYLGLLGGLGARARVALPAIKAAVDDPNKDVRAAAVKALAAIDGK